MAQIMACCLTAPDNYLKRYLLKIIRNTPVQIRIIAQEMFAKVVTKS